MKDINKTTKQDVAYAAARAIVGSIPLAGAAASELLGLIVTNPLEKRRSELLTDIGERLKNLEEVKQLDIASLSENQQFIDTVLQATTYALKTSENEKIEAFKNAIINTALNHAPDKTVSQIFLNLIDNFTAWHIKILHLFNNPEGWFKTNNRPIPNYMMSSLNSVVSDAYPELTGHGELLNIIWADLKRAGLHNSGDLATMMSGNGLLSPRTTEMGKKFLNYIQE